MTWNFAESFWPAAENELVRRYSYEVTMTFYHIRTPCFARWRTTIIQMETQFCSKPGLFPKVYLGGGVGSICLCISYVRFQMGICPPPPYVRQNCKLLMQSLAFRFKLGFVLHAHDGSQVCHCNLRTIILRMLWIWFSEKTLRISVKREVVMLGGGGRELSPNIINISGISVKR